MKPFRIALSFQLIFLATWSCAEVSVMAPLPQERVPASGSAEIRDWVLSKGETVQIECYGGSPGVFSRNGQVRRELDPVGRNHYVMDGRADGGRYLPTGRYLVICPDGTRNSVIWIR